MQPYDLVKNLEKNLKTYLGFHYHFFNKGFTSLDSTSLEGLLAVSIEPSSASSDHDTEVVWRPGSRALWDLKIGKKQIQIKGVKTESSGKIRLSSYRLGKFIGDGIDPEPLKNGILNNVNQIDSWYFIMVNHLDNGKSLNVKFFECSKENNGWIYDPDYYNFSYIKKATAWTFEAENNEVKVQIIPKMSHQLWYETTVSAFSKLPGVSLISEWTFIGQELPKPIFENKNEKLQIDLYPIQYF